MHRLALRDPAEIAAVVSSFKPEVVNHHAAQAEVPKSVADPAFDAQVNLIGGINLLKASVDNGVRKLIFISTGGALYGEPDVVPCDEDHPARPLSPYGTSKVCVAQYDVTVNELFRKLAILTDYKEQPSHGPRRKGDVYRIALDNTRAQRELGWQPAVSLEEGLSSTVDYFRQRVAASPA